MAVLAFVGGLGALVYSCVATAGVYAKQNSRPPVAMFAVLALLATAALFILAVRY